jgi:hypothetical protein
MRAVLLGVTRGRFGGLEFGNFLAGLASKNDLLLLTLVSKNTHCIE